MFWLVLLVLGGGWLTRRYWWPLIVVPLFPWLDGGSVQDQDSSLDLFTPNPLDELLDVPGSDSANQQSWDVGWDDPATFLQDDPNPLLVSVFDDRDSEDRYGLDYGGDSGGNFGGGIGGVPSQPVCFGISAGYGRSGLRISVPLPFGIGSVTMGSNGQITGASVRIGGIFDGGDD